MSMGTVPRGGEEFEATLRDLFMVGTDGGGVARALGGRPRGLLTAGMEAAVGLGVADDEKVAGKRGMVASNSIAATSGASGVLERFFPVFLGLPGCFLGTRTSVDE